MTMTETLPATTLVSDPAEAAGSEQTVKYQSGFGNGFESEALPGALPVGRNSPQRCAYGLYAEQLSGSPFTAPRASNERSWLYRIRPTVANWGRFAKADSGLWRTAPCVEVEVPPAPLRWDPVPLPAEGVALIEGIRTITTAGDAASQAGIGLGEPTPVGDRRPDAVEPGALVAGARRREGRAAELLGVEAVGASLGGVAADWQGAGQRLALETVAEACVVFDCLPQLGGFRRSGYQSFRHGHRGLPEVGSLFCNS